jgi:hypothetical protein
VELLIYFYIQSMSIKFSKINRFRLLALVLIICVFTLGNNKVLAQSQSNNQPLTKDSPSTEKVRTDPLSPNNTKSNPTIQSKPNLNQLVAEKTIAKNVPVSIQRKQKVYQSAVDFARWVDKFFGEEEALESASYDYLRMVNQVGWREDEGVNYRPRVRAKVRLPKIDKKFSLLFSDDSEQDQNTTEGDVNQSLFDTNKQHKTSAALNYESDRYQNSKFDTRVGINSSFDSYALIKHSYQISQTAEHLFRNYNYLFWREGLGYGINPKIEFDKVLSENLLFRWKYSIMRAEKSLGNEWHNSLSILNRYSEESWLSYDFSINGKTDYDYDVETYRLAIRYRHQFDIKWLYFEIEPELLWHRKPEYTDRQLIPGLILRLEIQFED